MENAVPPGRPPWECVNWIVEPNIQPIYEYKPSWEGWKEQIHSELNELKTQIDALEANGSWEIRKKLANPYELVYTQEDRNMPICLAKAKPLSRSYFKMIEILSITHFFTRFQKAGSIRSAHVCEGPGGFIQALSERCLQEHITIELSLAMSLRPIHVQIPGWKRAIPFLKKNPQVKILYGIDDTGDIYNLENQAVLASAAGTKKVHLFTADGGFDFKMDYMRQEQIAFRLIVASFATGFQLLANGGVIVVKLFDVFSTATNELICFVGSFFKEWTLYKPAMSRPCNSERYFIGVGFRGYTDTAASVFISLQKDLVSKNIKNLESLFTLENQLCFESINRFQKELETIQINTIQKAISLTMEDRWRYWRESYLICEEWCKYFKIRWKENLFVR